MSPPVTAKHGTPAMYSRGCRCDQCRESKRIEIAEWRKRRRERDRAQREIEAQTIACPRLPRIELEPLREHLLDLMDRGATPTELAHKCHVDYRTMLGWLTGRTKLVKRFIAERACDQLDLHPAMIWKDWVICRHGHTSCEKCGFEDFFEDAVAS